MIPKTLHIIWLNDGPSPNDCIQSWLTHNPDWQIKIWGTEDLTTSSWVNANAMRTAATRQLPECAELMRWEILYNEGGFVIDPDTVCVKPIPDWLLDTEAFACALNEEKHPGVISARYFASRPGNQFVGQVILDIQNDDDFSNKKISAGAGCERLTATQQEHKYDGLVVLPSYAFMPRFPTAKSGYVGNGYIYGFKKWSHLFPNQNAATPDAFEYTPGLPPTRRPTPLITVAIPTWNSEKFIAHAIDSALSQDYQNIEVVVVDDGSTDNTAALVGRIKDRRIRYIKKQNSGIAATRNRLIAEARGTYILWLDSDDMLTQGLIDAYADVITTWPEVSVCYGNLIKFDSASGKVLQEMKFDDHLSDPLLVARLFMRNHFPNPGTLVKTSVAKSLNGYDENLRSASDYDFWFRAAARGHAFKHIGRLSCAYRWHESNVSHKKDQLRASELYILRKALKEVPITKLTADLPWDSDRTQAESQACERIVSVLRAKGEETDAEIWRDHIRSSS